MMYSFEENKKRTEVRGFVQRIANTTAPNFPTSEHQLRTENRYNRTLPVLLLPWEDDQPVVTAPLYAVTKDISDVGLALVLREPIAPQRVVCGFWLDSPHFVVGEMRQCVAIGGGFWQIGIEMTELLTLADLKNCQRLEQLVSHLDPSQKAKPAVV